MFSGYGKILVIVLLIFSVFTALTAGYFYFGKQRAINTTPKTNSIVNNQKGNYEKGEVVVVFKKNVSESDALNLLNKYNLQPKNPENFYKFLYIVLKSKDKNIDDYVEKIKNLNLSIIKGVNVFGKDRGVDPWITVDFDPRASMDDVNQILNLSENLYVEDQPDPGYEIVVSEGEEEYFVKQLSQESMVSTTYLNTLFHIN